MALMREPGGRGTGKEERRLVSTGFRFGYFGSPTEVTALNERLRLRGNRHRNPRQALWYVFRSCEISG
jgi:hypothetical protein